MRLIPDIPTNTEQVVLSHLIAHGESHALAMVQANEELSLNSIYVIVTRMHARGLVTSRLETDQEHQKRNTNHRKRRLFKITAYGRKMHQAHIEVEHAAARATRGIVKPAGAY